MPFEFKNMIGGILTMNIKEVKNLKERLNTIENERDEIAMTLHIITVHCCNLIAEKEGKKVEDVPKEMNESIDKIMHGI